MLPPPCHSPVFLCPLISAASSSALMAVMNRTSVSDKSTTLQATFLSHYSFLGYLIVSIQYVHHLQRKLGVRGEVRVNSRFDNSWVHQGAAENTLSLSNGLAIPHHGVVEIPPNVRVPNRSSSSTILMSGRANRACTGTLWREDTHRDVTKQCPVDTTYYSPYGFPSAYCQSDVAINLTRLADGQLHNQPEAPTNRQ